MAITLPVAIDPMALILSGEAYARWAEMHHPHVPKIGEIEKVLSGMKPEERRAAVARAEVLRAAELAHEPLRQPVAEVHDPVERVELVGGLASVRGGAVHARSASLPQGRAAFAEPVCRAWEDWGSGAAT